VGYIVDAGASGFGADNLELNAVLGEVAAGKVVEVVLSDFGLVEDSCWHWLMW